MSSLNIDVVRSVDGFDQLREAWNELLERSDVTIFQTFEWQRVWWEHFGKTNRAATLHIVLIRDCDKLIAVAPVFMERVHVLGIFSYRQLSFIGKEISDYLNVIAESGREAEVASALAAHFASLKHEFDIVILEDIPNGSLLSQLLFDVMTVKGLHGQRFEITQCPRLSLQSTWEETLQSLSKKHRKDIQYELRNVNRNFETAFDVTADPDRIDADMQDFVAMHQQRWTLTGHLGVFSDTRQAEFHRAFARKAFDRGWLFLSFLRLNGKRIAVNYAFHFRKTVSTYLNGMIQLDEIAKYSPGKILHTFSIQEAIRRGCATYDFMRGRERYKYSYDAVDVPNWTIVMFTRPSKYVKLAFKASLLSFSARRRIGKEMAQLRHVTINHGLFSREAVTHVSSRFGKNFSDGIRKIRRPERNLEEK